MNITPNPLIAGKLRASDWEKRKLILNPGNASDWASAFQDFFNQRLQLRYIGPINVLLAERKYLGEGFSIVAIQCSIIEFLESTRQGSNYRFLSKGQKLQIHEYSSSSSVFVDFLTKREPFKGMFTKTSAKEFYSNVRCGLLHEARTNGAWVIKATNKSGPAVDIANHIVYRNNFQLALREYINAYGIALQTDRKLQEAFIRKFDGLCK